MRRIFWGFCRNRFLMSPLHYLSSRSKFWLRIRGDIRIQKTTPRYHRYGEPPTPRISGTESRQLPASLIRRVGDSPLHRYGESATEFFERKLSVSMIRRVIDSPHQWYGESPTPRITDTESRRLRVSLSRGVDDSADRWYGESLSKEKINLMSIFRVFNS